VPATRQGRTPFAWCFLLQSLWQNHHPNRYVVQDAKSVRTALANAKAEVSMNFFSMAKAAIAASTSLQD
jgi:hypothetical protein